MKGGKVSMEIYLIAVASFYHLQKTLAVHVAEDSIALIGPYSMEREWQVESSTLRALNWLQIGVFLDVVEVIALLVQQREILGQVNPLEGRPPCLIRQGKYIHPSNMHIASHLEGNTKEANTIFAQTITIPKYAGAKLITPRRISKQISAPRKAIYFSHSGSTAVTDDFDPLQKILEPIIHPQSKDFPL